MKTRSPKSLTLALASLLAIPSAIFGQQEGPTVEDQLRQALRDVTIQLRETQTEIGVVRAESDALKADLEALQKNYDKLVKDSAAEQAALQQNLSNITEQLEEQTAEAKRLADLLLKWQTAYEKMSTVAKAELARKESLATREQALVNEISQLKSDNRKLHALAVEILNRFEGFALGEAITAREPFTRIARVQLQEIIQNYGDEIEEVRLDLPGGERPVPASALDEKPVRQIRRGQMINNPVPSFDE